MALYRGRYHKTQAPGTPDMKQIIANNQILTPDNRLNILKRVGLINLIEPQVTAKGFSLPSPLIQAVVTAMTFQNRQQTNPIHSYQIKVQHFLLLKIKCFAYELRYSVNPSIYASENMQMFQCYSSLHITSKEAHLFNTI